MPRKLKNIQIDEVSSVDRGAGKGVKIMMLKRDELPEDVKTAISEAVAKAETFDDAALHQAVNQAVYALEESVRSIFDDEEIEDKTAAVSESIEQFKEHILGLAPGKTEKTMPKEADLQKQNDDLRAELAKREAEVAVLKLSDEEKKFCEDMSDEDKKKFAALTAEERKAKMKKREDDPIAKALSAENESLKKRLSALEETNTKVEFAKRAKDCGLVEADGEVLRKAYAGDAEAQKEVEAKFKALTEQVAKGKLFSEIGKESGTGGGGAADEMNAKAAELRKAEPKLTQQQAYDRAFNDPANKELAKRVRDEELAKMNRAA